MYLRRQGKPFGVLIWNSVVVGWSLCDDVHPNRGPYGRTTRPDRFNKSFGRALAMLMAATGNTLEQAVHFALQPSEPWQWKQRAVKEAIRRATFPILAERLGLTA